MHAPSNDYKVCQFIHACMFMVHVILDYLLLSLLITYCIALMTLPRLVMLVMKSLQVLMLSILVIILSIRSILSKKRLFDILQMLNIRLFLILLLSNNFSSLYYLNLVIHYLLILTYSVTILEPIIVQCWKKDECSIRLKTVMQSQKLKNKKKIERNVCFY